MTTTKKPVKYVTNTKTIGKQANQMYRELFPNCKRKLRMGRNNMSRFVTFLDENNNNLGYYTNQDVEKGYFVRYEN